MFLGNKKKSCKDLTQDIRDAFGLLFTVKLILEISALNIKSKNNYSAEKKFPICIKWINITAAYV